MESAKPFIRPNPNTYGRLASDHKVVLTVEAEIIVCLVDGLYRTQSWLSQIVLPGTEFFLAEMYQLLYLLFKH